MTKKIETADELSEFLDVNFARIVEEAGKLSPELDPVMRAGTIAGFLIKTGIALAAKNGAPEAVMRRAVDNMISEAFEALSRD